MDVGKPHSVVTDHLFVSAQTCDAPGFVNTTLQGRTYADHLHVAQSMRCCGDFARHATLSDTKVFDDDVVEARVDIGIVSDCARRQAFIVPHDMLIQLKRGCNAASHVDTRFLLCPGAMVTLLLPASEGSWAPSSFSTRGCVEETGTVIIRADDDAWFELNVRSLPRSAHSFVLTGKSC